MKVKKKAMKVKKSDWLTLLTFLVFFLKTFCNHFAETLTYMKIRKMNEAFVAFGSTLILICQTSPITLCGKSCDLERKFVVFATPVSQKRRCQPISFILDSLSAQINVPDTTFSRNSMKLLNHNASTLSSWVTLRIITNSYWIPLYIIPHS